MDKLFIGQGQPEYFRSHTHVCHVGIRCEGRGKRMVLVFDHPRDGLKARDLREQIVGDAGVRIILRLLVGR